MSSPHQTACGDQNDVVDDTVALVSFQDRTEELWLTRVALGKRWFPADPVDGSRPPMGL